MLQPQPTPLCALAMAVEAVVRRFDRPAAARGVALLVDYSPRLLFSAVRLRLDLRRVQQVGAGAARRRGCSEI